MHKVIDNSFKAILLTSLYVAVLAACAGSGDPISGASVSAENQSIEIESTSLLDSSADSKQFTLNEIESDDSSNMTDIPEYLKSTQNSVAIPSQYILYFPSDISKIDADDYIIMQHHAEFLLQNPDVMVSINGHADSQGSESYNQNLSQKRADTIANLLILFGVPESQLILAAHGESVPASDMTDWDANRRVELEYNNPVTISSRF